MAGLDWKSTLSVWIPGDEQATWPCGQPFVCNEKLVLLISHPGETWQHCGL